MTPDLWTVSDRFDPAVLPMADRHYNRRRPGTPQFAPPGRCLVLKRPDAFWLTSWPLPQYAWHAWAGAWVCTAFRNEGPTLSSELVAAAVAATRWRWPAVPPLGMVTFVNPRKVRHKRDPGRCFRRAGFEPAGTTARGLVVLRLPPEAMPPGRSPLGAQLALAGPA